MQPDANQQRRIGAYLSESLVWKSLILTRALPCLVVVRLLAVGAIDLRTRYVAVCAMEALSGSPISDTR